MLEIINRTIGQMDEDDEALQVSVNPRYIESVRLHGEKDDYDFYDDECDSTDDRLYDVRMASGDVLTVNQEDKLKLFSHMPR